MPGPDDVPFRDRTVVSRVTPLASEGVDSPVRRAVPPTTRRSAPAGDRRAQHRRHDPHGGRHDVVPRAVGRGPVVGRRDRAGRHPRFRGLVQPRRRRCPGRLAARVGGLRGRAASPDRGDQPPADRRPDQAEHRGGGGQRRRLPLPRRLRRRARRGAPLRPRGGVRHRRGLRARRRGARRVGRPSRGAGGRLGAALRGGRGGALPGQRAGLGGPRRRGGGAGRRTRPTHRDRHLRRGTTVRTRGGHGRAVRHPGRATRGRARWRGRPPQGGGRGGRPVRSGSGGRRPGHRPT